MAKNLVNSRLSFARIFILVENIQLRSSPLLVAAKRYVRFPKKSAEKFALLPNFGNLAKNYKYGT